MSAAKAKANEKQNEPVEPNSFEINKALAAVCADADTRYALSRAVILPNDEQEKVFMLGCDGRILAVAVGEGQCNSPFLLDKKLLAGKVGRLLVDDAGQVSFPFVNNDDPLPYPNVLAVLPKRADKDAEVAVSFNPELLAKLLKLFLGSPSVTLFVRDASHAVVLAGAEAAAVIMPMGGRDESDGLQYRRMLTAITKHLPEVIATGKGDAKQVVTLATGEKVDTATGETDLPEGTCSKCGDVGTTTSLEMPGRKPTPPLCSTCFDAVVKHGEAK
jgi:hypothetical protein